MWNQSLGFSHEKFHCIFKNNKITKINKEKYFKNKIKAIASWPLPFRGRDCVNFILFFCNFIF